MLRAVAVLLAVLVVWFAPSHQGYSARLAFQSQRVVACRVAKGGLNGWQ